MPHSIKLPPNLTIDDLLEKIHSYNHEADLDMVRLVYEFAAKAHSGQFRKSGEPYIVHPLSAAYILATMKIEVESCCARLTVQVRGLW
jgi:GTP pyrophosphokinase